LHLTARGTAEASAWYQKAFGAEELTRLVVPDGRLIHVQLRIGTLTLMLADEFPELESFGPQHFGGTYGAVYLHTRHSTHRDHAREVRARRRRHDGRAYGIVTVAGDTACSAPPTIG
jgi:uncharacterized glyoxalase superfamily protein PhnB